MDNLTKLILITLFILLVIQLLSYFYRRSKRNYPDRLKSQLGTMYKQLQNHINTADSIIGSEPISHLPYSQLLVAFQQTSYASKEYDTIVLLAPPDDLKTLLDTNLDAECKQIQALEKRIGKEIQERSNLL